MPKLSLLRVWQSWVGTSMACAAQTYQLLQRHLPARLEVFPLRGKLLNVREINQKALAENKEASVTEGLQEAPRRGGVMHDRQ